MSSIQIGALVYFTLIAIGAWIFFAIIFLQLKRFADMSCHVPLISKILAITLIALTIFWYVVIFSPSMHRIFQDSAPEVPTRTSGYFDIY